MTSLQIVQLCGVIFSTISAISVSCFVIARLVHWIKLIRLKSNERKEVIAKQKRKEAYLLLKQEFEGEIEHGTNKSK